MALRVVEQAGATDVGRQRQTNEDAFFERAPVFAVADGMGGARAGEVAARMAVEELAAVEEVGTRVEQRLRDVARSANRRIHEMAKGDSAHAGMGTTFTAAALGGRDLAVSHVGDSRLYRLRDGALERLTDDHSLVEELVRQGRLTPQEAEAHPQRSIITRALGPDADVEIDTFTHTARDGDVYLLCSDGLSAMLGDDDIARILAAARSLEDATRELIEAANDAGGKDNITVVLFRVGDDEGADPESDTLDGGEESVTADAVRAELASRDAAADAGTMALRPEEAHRGREEAAARGQSLRPASLRPAPRLPDERTRRRRAPRPKLGGGAALALLLLALALVGLYAASRQVYFIGTDDRGAVSLFRGVPYELPLGIDLYTHEYSSSVPARAIRDRRQRTRLLDHKWRSREDAERRILELERAETPR